uniref:Tetratricopeptide repeat domain 21A n=1 Tax=Monodelphis domestica TaxID=13616 RepID=F7FMX1_MONDO
IHSSNSNEKYFRHVQNAASEGLEKFSNDSVLQFFKAYGLLREEHIQDAIGELETLKSHPDVSLCSLMALIYAHKRCETIDREAISELENCLKETRKTAGVNALYYAALFLWLMGKNEKAKEYVDRMLKVTSGSREGFVLRGWVDFTSDKQHTVKKSIKYFDQGIRDTKDVLGLMGKASYFMMQQNYSGALEVVNQITVTFFNFIPAFILKMRLFLAQQDWEQTVETGLRILEKDDNNIDARQVLAVHEFAREGDVNEAIGHVRNLIKALETREPQNPSLHLKKVTVISRLCGKHQMILQQIYSFIERSFMLAPSDAQFANELGYQLILQERVKEASMWYTEAMKLDESSIAALTGIIWCQILEGNLEEAEQQLEFLKEVQQSLGKSEVLTFLQALLASKKHKSEQVATALLKEAAELHFSSMQGLPLSIEYFEKLNPIFLVNIVKEYLFFCPKQPRSPGQIISPLLKQAAVILNPVVKVAPALIDPLFLMAQVKYLSGELENAQSTLQRCLELDPTSADVHLLMAQIYLSQGNFTMCSHSLELGVSHNFQVRDHPLYHFIKARALNKSGDYPEAIKTLKMIMKLPTMKKGENKKTRSSCIRPSERVSILLELADALRLNGELHEATKIMQDAINEFSGTPEEIRITIANVDLALSKGNVEMPRGILGKITPKNPFYRGAKEKMGHFSFHRGKDFGFYIGCSRKWGKTPPPPPPRAPGAGAQHPPAPREVGCQSDGEAPEPGPGSLAPAITQASAAPLSPQVTLELAQLYLIQGDLDACEHHCAVLLQSDQSHETASVMMADLMFRKQKYESAISLYRQVLEKAPDNFAVLNKLIDLLRRSGKLEDAPAFFELSKKVSSRIPLEPGFNYCKGIYCWEVGKPKEASGTLSGGEKIPSTEKKESEQHGVRTAEKLLREFYPHNKEGQEQLKMLQSYCLLATKEKSNVETALGAFIEIAQIEKESVSALLAMAQAYMILKQVPKARTQLKRLAKAPWALADAEDLEKSWILLADIYCQSGKFDIASELLRRCVQYNKSCCKAYEYMGLIMEKEQSYKDAASNYELAWKYSNRANPSIGFKLAFNYLKDKRFVEAIEVCHSVLKEHPNYPKIREDILEKAQGSLRP